MGPSTNDISLIIKNDGGKDESLEERPSPSGSSGSSDRISSSMTAYSYNDKMHLNGHSSEKHYFNGMDKVDFRHNERLGGENGTNMLAPSSNQPSSYVPNNKTKNEVINQCNETSKSLDSFYKTKPSIPVKPIAATDEPPNDHLINDHSTRYDPNYLFTQRSHRSSSENSSLSTPSSGIYSSSDIFSQNGCSSLDKNDNDGSSLEDISSNSNDNYRNQAIEERSSVSEIVNKINNWSVSNGTLDWEKTKRRPVVSTNEMEKELNQEAQENGNYGDSGRQTIENGNQTRSYDIVQKEARKEEDVANNNDIDITTHESSLDRKETTKSKRMKGSLKNQDSNRKAKLPLGRRVSFDPLALLLDASLEGELELVKKTSIQVPNPSASNDEGITALHNATCAGHFDIVKYLVEIGCDVNVQDSDGWYVVVAIIIVLPYFGLGLPSQPKSNYVNVIGQDPAPLCSVVYALYDYESQNSDELTFKCGDCLHVLRRGDDQEKEWWWSRLGNQEGYIPRNLIGMFPRIKA
ncbi:hypothetical protein BLOT_005029 [Blomia tropicalis]|nr:hypothetical protein BLOT_005029 [Blomia tropicalis]